MQHAYFSSCVFTAQTYLQCLMFSVVQVIASEGELKASRALKEAADVIQESPSALQVLYLYKGTVTQDKFNLY
jgi:hypothetical protein